MGAKTEIAWTDASWNPIRLASLCSAPLGPRRCKTWAAIVLNVMATFAERNAVGDVMPQFRMLCPRADVVRVHVAAVLLPTALAGVTITGKNGVAPRDVIR